MENFEPLTDGAQEGLKKAEQPDWVAPMLATLTDRRFSDPAWLFERKFDGERCLAFVQSGSVRLFSRSRKLLSGTYPELVDALGSQAHCDMVVDGEVVALEGGRTSFSLLQQRFGITNPLDARRSPVKVHLYLFDVLFLDGYDCRGLTLRDRKSLLRKAIKFRGPLRYTVHRNGNGEAYLAHACESGWEGLMAKHAESPYVSRRSADWLKMKCTSGQAVVIGGFTEPEGSRVGLGALLVGYYEGTDLVYAGKVGTGYSLRSLTDLRHRLDSLETRTCPFRGLVRERKVHWVTPDLVAEVSFAEWTAEGKLRHPSYKGLRYDKHPHEVTREGY